MRKIGLLNGPNLNMLGTREPEVYGTRSLDDIVADLRTYAGERGAALRDHQSNVEGQLVDAIQEAMTWADGIVFNPEASRFERKATPQGHTYDEV